MPDAAAFADDAFRALKVKSGEYVLLRLPIEYGQDRSNVDKLAFQVRRSWPGLNVLIYCGDLEVTVVERTRG